MSCGGIIGERQGEASWALAGRHVLGVTGPGSVPIPKVNLEKRHVMLSFLTSSMCVLLPCLSYVTHVIHVSGLCSPRFVSWVSIYPFHLLMVVRDSFLFVAMGL